MNVHIIDLCEKLRDHSRRASDAVSSLEYLSNDGPARREQSIRVMREINATMTQLQEAAAVAVELSIRAGNSQKATADALGVPASTLAGAKKEFIRE